VNRVPLAAAGALVALAACASIAGLDGPNARLDPAGDDAGGTVGAQSISVTPAALALKASCAGVGIAEYFTVKNDGHADADYEIQVPDGSAFALRADDDASVGKLGGKIPAGGIIVVHLRATPTKAGSFGGQVIVRVGEHTTQVPVQVTVEGGSLAFTPNLIDFGEVRQNTPSQPQTIELENSGTQAVNVLGLVAASPDPSGRFEVDLGAGSLNIPPGEKATATATFYPGDAGPPVSVELVPNTQVPTCGELPKLTLRGTSVNQDVTVNPVSLDFGEVDCVSPGGATKTITVSNYASAPATFTVSAPPASWFTVAADDTTVPAANGTTPSTRTITVALKPVGADIGSHAEPIAIDVTSPISKQTTVTASVKSVGGVIVAVPKTLSGFRPDDTRSFGVRNTGNKYVYVRHVSSNPDAFAVTSSTDETALSPGVPLFVSVDVQFVSQTNGSHQAQIKSEKTTPPLLIPAGGNVCRAEVVDVSGMR